MSTRFTIDAAEYEYLLKTSDAELWRLGFQHRLWAELAHRGWLRAGFGRNSSVLDVGCGPGYAAVDLAQLVGPQGRIVAIDASKRFIEYLRTTAAALRLEQIEPMLGDVQALALEGRELDGAYIRWVLCFVEDPRAVIEGVARALRPGGSVVVQDYYHYEGLVLAPHSETFRRVVAAVDESIRIRQGDGDIMQRVPQMLCDAGFEITSIESMVRTARPHEPLWRWPETFFGNYLDVLREMNLVTEGDVTGFWDDWNRSAAEPGGFLATPPMIEAVARKR